MPVLFWRRTDLHGLERLALEVKPARVTATSDWRAQSVEIERWNERGHQALRLARVDTAFIDGETLTVTRSRQRYELQGPGRLRFVDLGLFEGFTADLEVDGDGLVKKYEGLFERVWTGCDSTSVSCP